MTGPERLERSTGTRVRIDGEDLDYFGGSHYLGLAHDPRVHEAVRQGLERFGLSIGASRETTGDTTEHQQLELDLAAFFEADYALTVGSGAEANRLLIGWLVERGFSFLMDARTHVSCAESIAKSDADVRVFPTCDAGAARAALSECTGPVAVFTDGLFTLDGAVAPVGELARCLRAGDVLCVDESHAVGVLGPAGRGSLDGCGVAGDAVIRTFSLTKGLGAHGGAVVGGQGLAELRTRPRVSASTPLPPALVAAAGVALGILRDEPARMHALRANARRLRDGLCALELSVPAPDVPIFLLPELSGQRGRDVHAALRADGLLAPLIHYPGAPPEGIIRITTQCHHEEQQIERLLSGLRKAL